MVNNYVCLTFKVKLEKVDIMCMLVSDKNFDQVLLELKEWLGLVHQKPCHVWGLTGHIQN